MAQGGATLWTEYNVERVIWYVLLLLYISVCFEIYDLNQDGYISRDEITSLLKKAMVRHHSEDDPDDGVTELVELVVKKMVSNITNK